MNMLKNKIVLLTGATDGIGKQTAFILAEKGATLLLHGKDQNKGIDVRNAIIEKTNNKNIFYFNADFTSFEQIKSLVNNIKKDFSKIDIIINNAGIFENDKIILGNGIEKNFMVNHLSPFTLTMQLLPLLFKAEKARIISVSSMVHAKSIDFDNLNAEKYYSGESAYSVTKLCNILFTKGLSYMLEDKNITVNSLHPGVIDTKLLRAGWGSGIGDSVIEGAKRILYLADSEKVEKITGKYFVNDEVIDSKAITYDDDIAKKLWDLSIELIKKSKVFF